MPAKIGWSTRGYIESIPLPQHGPTYTVIPHKDIINQVYQVFSSNSLEVDKELYRVTLNGNVASAIYHLKTDKVTDDDLGLVFFWLNSYDKSRSFTCSIGAYSKSKNVYYIKGNIASWTRKHTGTADKEYGLHICNQVEIATDYFNAIVHDREMMRKVKVSQKQIGHIMGDVYFTHDILSTDQATGCINLSKDKNSLFYKIDSLWDLYTRISFSLTNSHPSKWLNNQTKLHDLLMKDYCILPESEEQLPGQMSIFDVIEDVRTELVSEPDYFDLPNL